MDLRTDGPVLALFLLALVLLGAGLTGAYRLFGYALVAFLGVLFGIGFVRKAAPVTWVPPVVATAVLLASFVGLFAYEADPVRHLGDTVLGFQRGTAFLVYGVWLPAFFTLGVAFALVFPHLGDPREAPRRREDIR